MNSHKVNQVKVKVCISEMHLCHFIYLFIWVGGGQEHFESRRLFLQSGNICFIESLSTLILIFMQGGNSGFLTENWVGGLGEGGGESSCQELNWL